MRRYSFLIAIVILLALTHLFIFTGSVGLKYDSAKLKIEFDKDYQENRMLRYLESKGESLGHVEQVSASKLGMVYPEKVEYILDGSVEARP
ncbi:MAG TPA: hypothetical protein VMD02_06545 [Candidatus Omnitrophota bacterium]|nr:hypothetical protein [Candidatus Omnitrophota bacterium]